MGGRFRRRQIEEGESDLSYMHCPSCGLSVHIRAHYLTLDRCPRCLARRGAIVTMELSDRPGGAASPRHRPAGPVLGADGLRPASGGG
jgi:hypothetical protein